MDVGGEELSMEPLNVFWGQVVPKNEHPQIFPAVPSAEPTF